MQWLILFLPWAGGALATACLWTALRNHRRKRLVENLPTSKTLGVFVGLVELKGTAESETPLTSYLAALRCVHFEWTIEEEREESTTETETDSEGRTRTVTRRSRSWEKIADGGDSQPFYLKDREGAVLVRPTGAQIEPLSVFARTCSRSDPVYYAKGPVHDHPRSTGRRRFTEKALPLHASLYIVGRARERQDVVAAEIAEDERAELFLISVRGEARVRSGFAWAGILWALAGVVLLVGSLALREYLELRSPVEKARLYAQVAFAYLCVWLVGWLWNVFNDLVGLRNRVRQAWSLIDVQLKRRLDLIPNLVRIVAALKDHERGIQEHLALLRAQLGATPPGAPGEDHHALRPALAALVEDYPVLRGVDAFRELARQLAETETRIALARDYYNTLTTHYNTLIRQFPDGLVALTIGARPRPLFLAKDFERAVVAIRFAR